MWETLTSVPDSGDVLNGFAIVSTIIFGVVFLLAAMYSTRPGIPPIGDIYSRAFIQRSAAILAWISGIGLFFLLIRFLQINPGSFGLPIWILITLVLLVAALAYVGVTSTSDRRRRRQNRAGHRTSQLQRRPVKKRH